jgi:hypothetical protein
MENCNNFVAFTRFNKALQSQFDLKSRGDVRVDGVAEAGRGGENFWSVVELAGPLFSQTCLLTFE